MVEKLSLYAVGDIGIRRDGPGEDPKSALAYIAPTIKQADIAFCQLERNLTDRGKPAQTSKFDMTPRVSPNMAKALTFAGFNVVSFASNHTLDCGPEAMFDTLEVLKENNLGVIGAGKNIKEARKPLIVEKKGTKIGFLGYCSVPKAGSEAGPNKPGVAPMRAFTIYQQLEPQPSSPAETITVPDPQDIEAMEEDIRQLKPLVDVVIVSHHWGIHIQQASVAMYQRRVGHACINAGADLILGHHAHILKGTEVYKGKVIIYSMGNFALDDTYDQIVHEAKAKPFFAKLMELYGWTPDPDYPGYGMPFESRKTMIAKVIFSNKKIEKVSFLPCYINKNAEPEVMPRNDKRFDEVVDYMTKITKSQGLNAKYVVEGNEAIITT